jgi:hypothetical protein
MYGGGIYNSSASITVVGCKFSTNSATYDGGGMFNMGSSPTILASRFLGNTATSGGGGINNKFSSAPTITNCLFASNSATDGGGIDNIFSAVPKITNCTFVSNSAWYGGAISNEKSSTATVMNSILRGDTAVKQGNEVYLDTASSSASVSFSMTDGGYPSGVGILTADPLFIDSTGGDYHLGALSPAIDVGGCGTMVPLSDIVGNQRLDLPAVTNGTGNAIDLGAYEYQGTGTVITSATCN